METLCETLVIDSPEPIKSIEVKDGKAYVGSYAIRFSGPDEKDLSGEYFTAKTYLGSHHGDGADVLFNHGFSPTKAFDEICGKVFETAKATVDAVGVFVQHVLDLSNEYEAAIAKLCAAGKLKWSSGATSHLVRRGDSGEILRWPIAEFSYTPTPAEPRLPAIVPLKSLVLDEIQTDELIEALKAQWTTAYMNNLPDSAFLYIEPGGKKDGDGKTEPRSLRHFPYRDASGNIDLPHLRNALARIPQSNVSQGAKDKATAHAERLLKEATGGDKKPAKTQEQEPVDKQHLPETKEFFKHSMADKIMEPEIQRRIDDEVAARVEQIKIEQEKVDSAVKARTAEIQEIYAIGDKFGKRGEAARFVEEGKSIGDFQNFILSRLNPKTFVLDLPGPDLKNIKRRDFDAMTVGERNAFLKSGGKVHD